MPLREQVRKQVVLRELPFCSSARLGLLKSPEALQHFLQSPSSVLIAFNDTTEEMNYIFFSTLMIVIN